MTQRADRTTIARRPNAVWAWEFLRRNADYRRDYYSHRQSRPFATKLDSGATLLRAKGRSLLAEKWGLLAFADPNQPAHLAHLIWRPDWLSGALPVRLSQPSPPSDERDRSRRQIILSKLPTRPIIYEDAAGTRHFVMSGERYWLQLYADPSETLGDWASVQVRLNSAKNMQRRLDTASQLLALSRSETDDLSLVGRRRNIKPLADALDAYDMDRGFERERGSLQEVIEMIVGPARMAVDWGISDRPLRAQGRRAIRKAEALIGGRYRDLLAKKVL